MDPKDNPAGDASASNDANNNSEWDQAGLDFLSDHGVEPDKREEEQGAIQDEQTKSKEGEESKGASEGDSEGKKPNEESGASNDSGSEGTNSEGKPGDSKPGEEGKDEVSKPEGTPPPTQEQSDRQQRRIQLELEADRKDIAAEVREKLYSDAPTRLEDADGDPIESIGDVMRLQNPRTGKPFTAEEASQWLMQAQSNFEKQQQATDKEIADIAEVNLNIKTQADSIKEKFGELLKHMPNLRARAWAEYKNTLVLHEKDPDVIVKAPVSMEAFYSTMLAPYMKQVEDLKKQNEVDEKTKAENEQRKKDAEEKKKQSQGDREDIFSTRTKIEDISDPEEKEWAKVAKEYYED